jgi:hypothetical protein
LALFRGMLLCCSLACIAGFLCKGSLPKGSCIRGFLRKGSCTRAAAYKVSCARDPAQRLLHMLFHTAWLWGGTPGASRRLLPLQRRQVPPGGCCWPAAAAHIFPSPLPPLARSRMVCVAVPIVLARGVPLSLGRPAPGNMNERPNNLHSTGCPAMPAALSAHSACAHFCRRRLGRSSISSSSRGAPRLAQREPCRLEAGVVHPCLLTIWQRSAPRGLYK